MEEREIVTLLITDVGQCFAPFDMVKQSPNFSGVHEPEKQSKKLVQRLWHKREKKRASTFLS